MYLCLLKTSTLGIKSGSSAFGDRKLETVIVGNFRIVNILIGRTAGLHVRLLTTVVHCAFV